VQRCYRPHSCREGRDKIPSACAYRPAIVRKENPDLILKDRPSRQKYRRQIAPITSAPCDDPLSVMDPKFSLVILTSRFEETRGLFWDGPRNFEPRSDDEIDT
ncbi:hypothetical protein AVEN_16232-1, partial [Araneus ventricosus]